MEPQLRLADHGGTGTAPGEETRLSEVFAALADPVRRAILGGLDGRELLVSELAAPFDISLQAVSSTFRCWCAPDWWRRSGPGASAAVA